MSSLAKTCGMTPGALYWHFPSKVEILFAVLEQLVREGFEELTAAVVSQEPERRLIEYVEAFVKQQMNEAGSRNFGYSALVTSLPHPLQQNMWKLGRPYMELLREILREGQTSGVFQFPDLVVTSFAIGTACEYVFTWYRPDQPMAEEVVCKIYADLVLKMVARTPHEGPRARR